MELTSLTAISPIDGRYSKITKDLRQWFSEFGLIKFRLQIEIQWLQHLAKQKAIKELAKVPTTTLNQLNTLYAHFTTETAEEIKSIEQVTNHDVKAIEYFLKQNLSKQPETKTIIEFIHFGCTSEDINNLAYGLMLTHGRNNILKPLMTQLITTLGDLAIEYASIAMISRTHGQTATPTTMGKEIANVVSRLLKPLQQFLTTPILGKMNGAVGNLNAHVFTYPKVDWLQLTENFVSQIGLTFNPYTTQIEPHDYIAEILQHLQRFNTILIDLCRDFWSYISIGYFFQKSIKGEVGSSTMPHKINPIDFENAEGNLGISNSLAQHFIEKLPISRWQRDLTDSTVIRNLGVIFGHSMLAYSSIKKGLTKLALNQSQITHDLKHSWEVLAEPIQMLMRRYQLPEPYEQLKQLTRGNTINQDDIQQFIQQLALPEEAKAQLLTLSPAKYLGLAEQLANDIQPLIQSILKKV